MKRVMLLMVLVVSMLVVGCTKNSNDSQTTEPSTAKSQMSSTESTEPVETNVPETEDDHYPVTVITHNYAKEPVEITFTKAPEKVFAVYQNSIETLLALGLEDKIVAAAGLDQDVKPEYAQAFDQINYLAEFAPDKESVLMFEPDLILSWYSYFGEKRFGDVNFFHERGINTYMMQNSGAATERVLENEYTDILTLGKIFNVEEKAEAIVSEMREKVETIASKAQKMETKPRVLVMEVEKEGVRVYGDNTLGGDMVRQLGSELVTAPQNKMSNEDFIASNPDVIFTVYFGSSSSVGDADAAVSKIIDEPKYQSLNAVKNNRVYAISLGEMYCSGTRTLDGIIKLARGIYPEMEIK